MAEPLPCLELVVGHLADEFGPYCHPLEVFAARPATQPARHATGIRPPLLLRDLGLERLELFDQLLALGRAERRRVADVVDVAFLVIEA